MIVRFLRNISCFALGILLIFSGFVKAIDPLGFNYKFIDYLEAFGMDFMLPISFFLVVLLISTELLVGLNLLLRMNMKVTAWLLLLLMSFFTILTLISAITNPVSDCGCFGDAIILTNWQTFFKNLIFIGPAIFVFFSRDRFNNVFALWKEWLITIVLFCSVVGFSLYSYNNLPLIDFRPYKIGTDIAASMEVPEGMPVDEYKTSLIYEKNGVKKEFSLTSKEAPWNDSTWKWIETKNVLINKGYVPPIHDFSLTDSGGIDITQKFLDDKGYSLLIIAYDLETANLAALRQIDHFAVKAAAKGYTIYGMTASISLIQEQVKEQLHLSFDFYTTDAITLKTIIRSNPGIVLVKEGIVIGQWHYRNIPDDDFFKQEPMSYSLNVLRESLNIRLAAGVILILTILFLMINAARFWPKE